MSDFTYKKHLLSKSSFLSGVQCHKKLYFSKYFKHLKDPVTPIQQAVFDRGHRIGSLAQSLFKNGIDATSGFVFNYPKIIKTTQELIEKEHPAIFEAAFQIKGVLVLVDVLVKTQKGWAIYEVKSSTKLTQTHILDAAVQYFVLAAKGVEVSDVFILHTDTTYKRKGHLDVQAYFKRHNITQQVIEKQDDINTQIEAFTSILTQGLAPEIPIGKHCQEPYRCDFSSFCFSHIPKNSVFDIAGLYKKSQWELYQKDIVDIEKISDFSFFNEKQKQQIIQHQNKSSTLEKKPLQTFLNQLTQPLYFLDFETFAPAVPLFDNTSAYQAIVFQYSLHLFKNDNALTHREFIAPANGDDPRRLFAESLIKDCGLSGDIIVYNISFERSKIKELAAMFDDLSEALLALSDRLKDLMVPFKNRWYYHYKMQGSSSIKKVLPALVPELSYENLDIKEGATASNSYEMLFLNLFKGNKKQCTENLLAYCKLDTLAMVEIYKKLKKIAF